MWKQKLKLYYLPPTEAKIKIVLFTPDEVIYKISRRLPRFARNDWFFVILSRCEESL